jgi:glycosyltransferase involved in cell wall biosynthesis
MQTVSARIEQLRKYALKENPDSIIKFCEENFLNKLSPFWLFSYAKKLCAQKSKEISTVETSFNSRFKLSVITVNYNNKAGLMETVQSVIGQTARKDIQFIVVDGNSSDGSLQYISDVEKELDIAVFGDDLGVYDAMNRGVELSNSEYCIFMNSGDCFDSETVVSDILRQCEAHNYPDFIYGAARNEDASVWNPLNVESIWKGMICCHQSALFKTDLVRKFGCYSLDNSVVSDYQLIAKFVANDTVSLKIPLVVSKIEPVGISSDFRTRTIERWKVIRQLSFDFVSTSEIDNFYRDLLSTDGEWAAPHFHAVNEAQSNLVSNIEKRVCFLISMPRSGSTLLQRIIDQSEEISTAGEPWFMLPLTTMYDGDIVETSYGQHLNILAKNEFINDTKLPDIIENAQKVYADSIYSTTIKKFNTRYFLDKTPRYVHIVDKLAKLYPHAKFIVLKRNPAAVISSYATTWYDNNYEKVLSDQLAVNDFIDGFRKLANFCESGFKNKLVVTYESLVTEPEKEAARIFDYLGLNFNANFVNYNQSGKIQKFTFGDPSSVYSKNRPDPAHNSKWLKSLKDAKHAKSFLKAYGLVPDNVVSILGYQKGEQETQIENKFALRLPEIATVINALNVKVDSVEYSRQQSNDDHGSIGVLITNYNNSFTILDTLSSVINQTKKPDLLVVADDASTDSSVLLVKEFIEKHPDFNIRLIERNLNVGVTRNRDDAIRDMDVDLVTTLDGDDLICPRKLEMEYLKFKDDSVVVAFSDIVMLTEGKQTVLDTSAYGNMTRDEMLVSVCGRTYPVPRDMTFKKSLFIRAAGFDVDMEIYEDWALKMRLIASMQESERWSHSGELGTIYDRRNLGLSGREPIVLAYGQLLALARNCELLTSKAIAAGLKTVSTLLKGGMKQRLLEAVSLISCNDSDALYRSKLKRIWYERNWKLNPKQINELIWNFAGKGIGLQSFFVCTPVFNGVSTINETIKSVLEQEGQINLHYHIQDGNSSDGTLEVIKDWKNKIDKGIFKHKFSSLKFTYDSRKDKGMYDAITTAFSQQDLSGNEWLTWINSDDHFVPGAFKHVDGCSKKFDIRWITGISSVKEIDGKLNRSFRPMNSAILKRGLADGNCWDFMQQEGTFFKASVWGSVDKNEFRAFRYAGDWNLWYQMAQNTELHITRRVLANFCKVSGQLSEIAINQYNFEINEKVTAHERLSLLKSFPVSEGVMSILEEKDGVLETSKGSVLGKFVSRLQEIK